jgi:hypothetical protein
MVGIVEKPAMTRGLAKIEMVVIPVRDIVINAKILSLIS